MLKIAWRCMVVLPNLEAAIIAITAVTIKAVIIEMIHGDIISTISSFVFIWVIATQLKNSCVGNLHRCSRAFHLYAFVCF